MKTLIKEVGAYPPPLLSEKYKKISKLKRHNLFKLGAIILRLNLNKICQLFFKTNFIICPKVGIWYLIKERNKGSGEEEINHLFVRILVPSHWIKSH